MLVGPDMPPSAGSGSRPDPLSSKKKTAFPWKDGLLDIWLPGEDSNLEWEDQNLLCYQLHHRVRFYLQIAPVLALVTIRA